MLLPFRMFPNNL